VSRDFVAAVDRGLRRARLIAAAEGAAWGIAVAAWWPIAGVAAALGVASYRWRQSTRTTIVRAFERATPDARNIFVTAEELHQRRLAASERMRERVAADASARARTVDIRRVARMLPVWTAAGFALLSWTIVLMARSEPARALKTLVMPAAGAPSSAGRRSTMTIAVTVRPPSYIEAAETHAVDPAELRGVEGSVVTLSIDATAGHVTIEHDGEARTLDPQSPGRFSDRLPLTKTGYLVVSSDAGDRRTLPVVVSPDAPPAVRMTAPGRDLVIVSGAGAAASIRFATRATDDYGLRSLSLRYTKVSGSGEEYAFTEGEIPLDVARANPRDWSGSATRTLADLGLQEGDMLVYRAVAADARPGDGASSDAFFIEISRLGVAAGDAFTLPEQETRYALSQQMLIVKTDRLARRRGALTAEQFGEASLNLAVEQRMIRAEFVFMLGGEIEDEEVEAERSVELQAGRLANRGQRDLRAATIAMSEAEKLLTAVNPPDALVAEKSAVAALQRAFARDRYILRASPNRVDLDPRRRLSGNLSGASSWSRQVPTTPGNRRLAQLQDLLKGLGDLAVSPDRSRTIVLAETALRIDAQSPALRQAAVTLQRAADGWTQSSRADQQRAIRAAAESVEAEAKRALPGAPVDVADVAPGLRRALREAAR